jgi:hypothetical protein
VLAVRALLLHEGPKPPSLSRIAQYYIHEGYSVSTQSLGPILNGVGSAFESFKQQACEVSEDVLADPDSPTCTEMC